MSLFAAEGLIMDFGGLRAVDGVTSTLGLWRRRRVLPACSKLRR